MPRKLTSSERARRDLRERGFPFDPQPVAHWYRYVIEVLEVECSPGGSIREENLAKPVLKRVGYRSRGSTRRYLVGRIRAAVRSLTNKGVLKRYKTPQQFVRYKLGNASGARLEELKQAGDSGNWATLFPKPAAKRRSNDTTQFRDTAAVHPPPQADERKSIDELERSLRRDSGLSDRLLDSGSDDEGGLEARPDETDSGDEDWYLADEEVETEAVDLDGQSAAALASFLGEEPGLADSAAPARPAPTPSKVEVDFQAVAGAVPGISWDVGPRRAKGTDRATGRAIAIRLSPGGGLNLEVGIVADELRALLAWNATHWPGITPARLHSGEHRCQFTLAGAPAGWPSEITALLALLEDVFDGG
jgi:hypothetical protein